MDPRSGFLTDQRRVQWRDRAHFFGVAAGLMRRILVDHARKRGAQRRGGGEDKLSLDDVLSSARNIRPVCISPPDSPAG